MILTDLTGLHRLPHRGDLETLRRALEMTEDGNDNADPNVIYIASGAGVGKFT